MSIQALVGLPRHGKSYSAVELFILAALKEKRFIVTNIPLIMEAILADFPDSESLIMWFDLDKAREEDDIWNIIPGGSLVLLDELWRIWPSGLKTNEIPKRQLSFIKEHGHYLSESGREMDIVLVTQDLNDIAVAVRGMVETTIICTKMTDLGVKSRFRRDYHRGAIKGLKIVKASFIRSDLNCKYEEKVWKYYKSHTKSENTLSEGGGNGVVNATVFNGWGFKLGVIFLLFLVVVVAWAFMSTSDDLEKMTKPKEIPQAQPNPIVDSVQVAKKLNVVSPAAPPKPNYSQTLRLVGISSIGKDKKIVLVHDGWKTRRIPFMWCAHYDFGYQCTVDGEIVTEWTGPRNMMLAPKTEHIIAANDR